MIWIISVLVILLIIQHFESKDKLATQHRFHDIEYRKLEETIENQKAIINELISAVNKEN